MPYVYVHFKSILCLAHLVIEYHRNPRPSFNIKIVILRYENSHYKDEAVFIMGYHIHMLHLILVVLDAKTTAIFATYSIKDVQNPSFP